MSVDPQAVEVTWPDGRKETMFLTVTGPSWYVAGYYDDKRRLWVHEVHHEDGSVDRLISPTIAGPFTAEKP